MREPLYDAYTVMQKIEKESGNGYEGIAYRMNRSKEKVFNVVWDAAYSTDIFTEILNEFGYDVIIRNRSTGEERELRPPKQYKRARNVK